jgi:integrase
VERSRYGAVLTRLHRRRSAILERARRPREREPDGRCEASSHEGAACRGPAGATADVPEFLRLITRGAISIEARRIYAIATYLYVRPQELYALRWPGVDWLAREVRIHRKLDVRTGEEKPGTKSDAGSREVPIHENLMPLLEAMHGERESDDARIIPLVGSAFLFERFADQTRRHIELAGIDRAELVGGSADLLPFDFRSWRTTGCTWLAMLGTDS